MRRRKKKAKSKKLQQRKHARRRFEERLGISLNKEMRRDLVHRIQNNEFSLYEKQSHRVRLLLANIEDREVILVYYRTRKNIVTVLLPELMNETK
jgi:hypothetical protein